LNKQKYFQSCYDSRVKFHIAFSTGSSGFGNAFFKIKKKQSGWKE